MLTKYLGSVAAPPPRPVPFPHSCDGPHVQHSYRPMLLASRIIHCMSSPSGFQGCNWVPLVCSAICERQQRCIPQPPVCIMRRFLHYEPQVLQILLLDTSSQVHGSSSAPSLQAKRRMESSSCQTWARVTIYAATNGTYYLESQVAPNNRPLHPKIATGFSGTSFRRAFGERRQVLVGSSSLDRANPSHPKGPPEPTISDTGALKGLLFGYLRG